MNNQITILDRNNQALSVNLICYFSNNNKKYVFYDKNERVQDGLIKMYVSEENTGLNNDITQDEWNNLKKVMQGIITGNMVSIEFLAYNNPVKFNEPKVIALNDANINSIRNAYKNVISTSNVSEPILNKDILSQNFGNNTDVSVTPSVEQVQISSIPNIQNDFNMEATPVNLNMVSQTEGFNTNMANTSTSVEPAMNNLEPLPNINESVQQNNNESVLNINSIKPGGIDSGFRVSNGPNIFDNPTMPQITEEELNNTKTSNDDAINTISNLTVNSVSNDEITNKKIELNNRKIKLFEELANIYKEENELLKSDNNDVLEHTASNLFNSNGTLNDSEVLR